MKKLILSAAFLAFAGIASVKANEIKILSPEIAVQDSTVKTPVKLEELPDSVKATLASDAYKDWTPTAAFWVKEEGGVEYYQINVKKEEEVGSVKIKKDGTPVE